MPLLKRSQIGDRFAKCHNLDVAQEWIAEGKIVRMVGMTLEAVGCRVPVGGRCKIFIEQNTSVEAEVVGFNGEKTYLMAFDNLSGIHAGAKVIAQKKQLRFPVSDALLGRVLGGTGQAIDGKEAISSDKTIQLHSEPINPLLRQPISVPLDAGVRSINSLLTIGRGQRLGLFAGSGVGKSVLLGMMTKYSSADVVVVGLIGERGREVKEFIEHILGPEGRKRAVVIASPADDAPLKRLSGAMLATAIAEYFRDQGKHTLLLMDSLTRYAQAQREIGLAVGEPPATKGYPPSVFAKLPHLVERAGNGERGGGSITAFYTVLAEGDDQNDPIADAARAILDGHVVLSRRIAETGHYPAIDIEASISRALPEITARDHQTEIMRFRQLFSAYQQNRDLISIGAYQAGSDPRIDEAINMQPRLLDFLRQSMHEPVALADSLRELHQITGG